MLPDLKKRFDAVEAQKADVLARVAARSDAEQRRAPRAGAWSLLEVVHHLVLAEEGTARQVEAATTAAPDALARRPRLGRIALPLVLGVLRHGIPVPAPPEMIPQTTVPLPELAERWAAARRALAGRLEAVSTPNAPPQTPVALHPLLGPLGACEALDLLDAHLRYHLRRHFKA